MPRKKASLSMFKKSTLTILISLLLHLFYQILEPAVLPATTIELPKSDQPVKLYSSQTNDNLSQLYIQAINQAQESLTLAIYSLLDKQVIQALNKKCQEGVPLYVVCDAKASIGITKNLPQAKIVRRAGQGLTHKKILIVDDRHIILGSSNLTRDSLKVYDNLVIAFENPAMAKLLVSKIKSMDEQGNYSPLMHQKTKVGSQHVELWVLPDDPMAVSHIIKMLRAAQKSIKVAMFAWTRMDFTKELLQASLRGVKVEAVMDRYQAKGSGSKIVQMLSKGGIPIRVGTGKGLFHHKLAYIDDSILINGSANWTAAAFKKNDDCFLVIYPLTEDQKEKMEHLWQYILKNSEAA